MPPSLRRSDPTARPPQRWDATTFYSSYAFHGPAIRGLEHVHSVGAAGIEATVRVTRLPGIDQAALLLDPALLDCAGQLVAFWLLEEGGRAPSFGIFPVSATRVTVLPLHAGYDGHPACVPGSLLLCRATVALQAGGLTRADVAFLTQDGHVVATVEGLVQRLLEFPPGLATRLFGGPAQGAPVTGVLEAPFSQPVADAGGRVRRRIDAEVGALLQEGQGIWARLLARMVMSADECPHLHVAGSLPNLQPQALLDALAAKEAAQAWAQEHLGAALTLDRIRLVPAGEGDAASAFHNICYGGWRLRVVALFEERAGGGMSDSDLQPQALSDLQPQALSDLQPQALSGKITQRMPERPALHVHLEHDAGGGVTATIERADWQGDRERRERLRLRSGR